MTKPHITVISTGLHPPTKDKCIASVMSQKGADFTHIYVDSGREVLVDGKHLRADDKQQHLSTQAGKCIPGAPILCNLTDHLEGLPPEEVVCWVDGDDWLKPGALKLISDLYEDPNVWCSYGQFEYIDGEPGFALEYMHEDYRHSPWYGTHLKTFRAGLWDRIHGEDFLLPSGQVIDLAVDMAVMFPILEMAGLEHSRFNPVPIYVYNIATSFIQNNGAEGRKRELTVENFIRKKTPYMKVRAL